MSVAWQSYTHYLPEIICLRWLENSECSIFSTEICSERLSELMYRCGWSNSKSTRKKVEKKLGEKKIKRKMTENYTTPSQLFQPRADLVRNPRPSLRAESNVKVNSAMGTLIRAAQLRPEHKVSYRLDYWVFVWKLGLPANFKFRRIDFFFHSTFYRNHKLKMSHDFILLGF